jgi:hypothetical protein
MAKGTVREEIAKGTVRKEIAKGTVLFPLTSVTFA